jgi:hypothetical protein
MHDHELDEALDLLHRDARTSDAPLTEARAVVMAAAEAPAVLPRVRPLRRRRVLPIAAAAAAVLAVTAVVVQVQSPDSSSVAAPDVSLMSAVKVLNDAADLQINAVDQPLGLGQYRYIDEHGLAQRSEQKLAVDGDPTSKRTGSTYTWEYQRQEWIPADQTREWLERRQVLSAPKWIGGTMPEAEATPPKPLATDVGERRAACGDFFPDAKPKKVCGDPTAWDNPDFYKSLPRDPDQLFAWLKDAVKLRGEAPSTLFHFGIEILRAGVMPADLRADFYRALAKIPGMKVFDAAVNQDGKTGIALGLDDVHQRRDLIIDPKTGNFIGERLVAGPQPYDPWVKPGTVTGYTSITTAVTTTPGTTP